jgi:hypothetical protein
LLRSPPRNFLLRYPLCDTHHVPTVEGKPDTQHAPPLRMRATIRGLRKRHAHQQPWLAEFSVLLEESRNSFLRPRSFVVSWMRVKLKMRRFMKVSVYLQYFSDWDHESTETRDSHNIRSNRNRSHNRIEQLEHLANL